MEPSNNPKKNKAMKNYKRAKFAYNLAIYSLTSIITCFFFSSPFWFSSITNHFLFSSLPSIISFCFNTKCFFVLGNLIVIILVGESKLKQSPPSPTSDIYDEYVARSRRTFHQEVVNGSAKPLYFQEKINKKEMKFNSTSRGEEKKKGMRSCKSEVWGENGMLAKMEKTKDKKEERGEKIKMGMRSSKSAVWTERETKKMEKAKSEKEEQSSKTSMNDEVKKMGLRSSKSAVWSEKVRLKMERGGEDKKEDQSCKNVIHHEEKKMGMRSSKSAVWSESVRLEIDRCDDQGKKEEQSSNKVIHHEEKKTGMRSSRSAVWDESEIVEREKGECVKKEEHGGMMKMGMRSCRSEIWSESEIMRLGKTHGAKEEEQQQLNVFNKRVEDFIARVNKQRLLEAKIVDHGKG